MNILIGADPEVFVYDYFKHSFLSGEGMIPGTKHEPFKIDGGAIQVDGVALEFNIDPAATCTEFVGNVTRVFTALKNRVREEFPQVTLKADPVADFDPDYFENNVSFKAKILGCDPDFNAYTGHPNDPPQGERSFRTGSGHVHVGWTTGAEEHHPVHTNISRELVRWLDVYLALPSRFWDYDKRRRTLYGQLGAYRPKHYGLEYRVLSNAWLVDEKLIEFVYSSTRLCVDRYFSHTLAALPSLEEVNHVWNDFSLKDLQAYLEDNSIPMPRISEVF